MYKKFLDMIDKGFGEDAILQDGSTLKIDKVYPFDGLYSTVEEVPESVKQHKHYVGLSGYDIKSVAEQVKKDYGKVDYLIHSLANGPEVEKPLLEVSRKGYLGASSSSAYSLIAMVQQFGPFMTSGGSAISISYIAAEKCVPGYGGGMSSAKAALESDTRVLAWEAGRKWGIRINCISAGPAKTRAANAIKKVGTALFIGCGQVSSNDLMCRPRMASLASSIAPSSSTLPTRLLPAASSRPMMSALPPWRSART
mmetsp:Transcript_41253/g.110243  ORF Transcript_41253/g.110243 Transcript_41253/m.110243 type:complete len:254 (+) Transcript_41253:333-1094(+)